MADPIPSNDPHGLTQRSFQVDPYPTFARLRTEAPAYYTEGWGGWLLTRYQDVLAGFKDPRLSSDRAAAFSAQLPAALRERMSPVTQSLSSWALLIDPPAHTRIRSLINKAFTPRLVEYLRPRIQGLVDELLDSAQAAGRMDVVADLARPLPLIVIGEMLGLPREDGTRLKAWSTAIATFFGMARPTPEILDQMRASTLEMDAYFHDIIARRRHSKTEGGDLLSTMISAEEQGAILSEQELVATCAMVLFAGHETTTHLVSNGIYLLLRHPEQRQGLLESQEAMVTAVEELLRYESPIQRLTRVALEDMEIAGQPIKKGQKVFLSIGAANRDPDHFPEADRLNLQRKENRHLGFGMGIHYCLGAALGRLEGQISLGTLLRRFPNMKLLDETPERLENVAFRGFKALPIGVA